MQDQGECWALKIHEASKKNRNTFFKTRFALAGNFFAVSLLVTQALIPTILTGYFELYKFLIFAFKKIKISYFLIYKHDRQNLIIFLKGGAHDSMINIFHSKTFSGERKLYYIN